MIKLPALLLSVELEACEANPGQASVEAGGHPPILYDGPVPEDLEILGTMATWRLRYVKAVGHAHAVDRRLRDAIYHLGGRQSRDLEDGRINVDDVMELASQPASSLHAPGPGDRKGVAGTAEMGSHLLHPLEGGI